MRKKSKSITNKNIWNQLSKELRYKHPSCEVCSSLENLQVHHSCCSKFYKKSILRFEVANLSVLCPKCHFMAHKCSLQFMEWFRKNKPNDYKICLDILGVL